MESDERFKHLASDPRFKPLRRKQRKVVIDERFQSMFTDDKFKLKYTRDKRGRKQNKTSGDDLKKYYSLETKNPEDETNLKDDEHESDTANESDLSHEEEADCDDEVDDLDSEDSQESDEEETSSSIPESELSSSSDESESEAGDSEVQEVDEIEPSGIEYNWQPLDEDAEKADTTTKRIAMQNMDWDHLDVKDIYTLVNSIRPPIDVKIYVSEFGKERLANEAIEGPKEIVDMPKVDEVEEEYNDLKEKMESLKNRGSKACRVNEYEDAEEGLDPKNLEMRERIRRYQLNRMKYFYAVAEFDSVESAEAVYKELDGLEYEGSSLELDLRFVPDDMEFDSADVRAECNRPPDPTTYKAPQFINTALQQTTVKLTWDETDNKRQDKLRRAYNKEELERDDLDAYLASETDTEEEDELVDSDTGDVVSVVTANSEARALKYKALIKSLDEEEAKKKKVDVDVEWGNFSEDEQQVHKSIKDAVQYDEDDDQDDDDDDDGAQDSDDMYEDSEEEIRARKSAGKKTKSKAKSKKRKRRESDDNSDLEPERDELNLLVMDVNSKGEEFNFNPDDERFKAVYESGLYNIDPSHPNFKRTQAFDLMAEKKRLRRQRSK